ncbi:MAG: hypothetical protein EAX96_06335 [Candidatus Lokiarchaeota archaeon]|nr:hypothetical protein [Candidatus Lokiarchaeota archaeon]
MSYPQNINYYRKIINDFNPDEDLPKKYGELERTHALIIELNTTNLIKIFSMLQDQPISKAFYGKGISRVSMSIGDIILKNNEAFFCHDSWLRFKISE